MQITNRSILPIVGNVMSSQPCLSKADIESLKTNMKKLAKSQQKLKHVTEENMFILKTVQGQVVEKH